MPEPKARPAMAWRTAQTHAERQGQLAARLLLGAMSLFIVYGSLFPFDFNTRPSSLSSFLDELDLLANPSDALDNLILFLPLGAALQASFTRPWARALGLLLVVGVLAFGIQLLQLYLPSRTASLSDVVWNTLGTGAGMLAAARIRGVLAQRTLERDGEHDNFLLCLVAAWICYESFPFVPTLDVGMLRAHIRPALIAPPFELSRLLQHAAAATLAACSLMHLGWLRQPARGLVLVGAMVVGLEVCVPYGALRRETLLGIVLGLAAGYAWARSGAVRTERLVFLLALSMIVFTVLTPYRSQGHSASFSLVPFSHFLWQNTLAVIPPTAFEALAVGAFLWAGLRIGHSHPVVVCILIFLLMGALEAARVGLAGYRGDTTFLAMVLLMAPCVLPMRPNASLLANPSRVR